MAVNIFPSETPTGTYLTDPCNRIREYQLSGLISTFRASYNKTFIYSGMDFSGTTLVNGTISAGYAGIRGYLINTDSTVSVPSLIPQTNNYVFLQITKTGSLATGVQAVVNTTGNLPDDAAIVAKVSTDTGAVTGIWNSFKVTGGSPACGSYTGDGGAGRDIFLGIQTKFVMLFGISNLAQYFSNTVASGNGFCIYLSGAAGSYLVNLESTDYVQVPILATWGFSVGCGQGMNALGRHTNYNGAVYNYAAFF